MRQKTRRVRGGRANTPSRRRPEPALRITPQTFPDDMVARLVDDLVVPALLSAWARAQAEVPQPLVTADNDWVGGVAA